MDVHMDSKENSVEKSVLLDILELAVFTNVTRIVVEKEHVILRMEFVIKVVKKGWSGSKWGADQLGVTDIVRTNHIPSPDFVVVSQILRSVSLILGGRRPG